MRQRVRVRGVAELNRSATNKTGFDLWEHLRYRVGKRVTLAVNDRPETEGARQVAVRPIDAGAYDRLVYRDWVRQNAAD